MYFYLTNLALIIVWGFLLLKTRCGVRQKQLACILFSIAVIFQWVILSGFRDLSIGSDTLAYQHIYVTDTALSWKDIFRRILEELIIFKKVGSGCEAGYLLLQKAVYSLGGSYRLFLVFVALFFHGMMGWHIYRNSKSPYISWMLYSVLFYSFFAFTGLRQTIAMAFVIFIGYEQIKKRKLVRFLLILLIGFMIHKSVIAFLPFYWLADVRLTDARIFIYYCTIGILFIFRWQFWNILTKIVGYSSWVEYKSTPLNFTILYLVVLTWAVIRRKKMEVCRETNALFLGAFLLPLVWFNPSAMRAVYYYSLFLLLAVPDIIISYKNDKNRMIYEMGTIFILLLFFIRTGPEYQFMPLL